MDFNQWNLRVTENFESHKMNEIWIFTKLFWTFVFCGIKLNCTCTTYLYQCRIASLLTPIIFLSFFLSLDSKFYSFHYNTRNYYKNKIWWFFTEVDRWYSNIILTRKRSSLSFVKVDCFNTHFSFINCFNNRLPKVWH